MAVSFCPGCGKPVSAADAQFCQFCGRSFMVGESQPQAAIPATPSVPIAAGVPFAATPSYAPVGVATATAAPPSVVIAISPKSSAIAVLLEFLLPGAGAMYAGRVAMGVWWLVSSIVAAIVNTAVLVSIMQSALYSAKYSADYGYEYDFSGYNAGLVVTSVIALVWLIVRCVYASRYARQYNVRLATQVAGSGATLPGLQPFSLGASASQPALVSRGRAIGVTVGLALVGAVSGLYLPYVVGMVTPVWLALAFWIALTRLPYVPWQRVALEVLGWTAAAFVVSAFLAPPLLRMMHLHYYYGLVIRYMSFTDDLALLLATLVALGFAQAFAPWLRIRPTVVAKLPRPRIWAVPVAAGVLLIVWPALVGFLPLTISWFVVLVVIAVFACVSTLRRLGKAGA